MKARKTAISALLAIIMLFSLAVPAFATSADSQPALQQNEDENTHPGQSFEVGNLEANKPRTVLIFKNASGHRGTITVKIDGFSTEKYICNIMAYTTKGLLMRENDWLGTNGSPTQFVNPAGENAVTAIYMSIYPRPKLFGTADYRMFTVTTTW